MESFLEQCVEKYLRVAGPGTVLEPAKTPFLSSSGSDSIYRRPYGSGKSACQWCSYCEDDRHQIPSREQTDITETEPGKLASSAASVLMKCLYVARMCRFDLLRAVQGLARFMTKWTVRQDQELHQLMSYIHHSKSLKMIGWVLIRSMTFRSSCIQTQTLQDVQKPCVPLLVCMYVSPVLVRTSQYRDRAKGRDASVSRQQKRSWWRRVMPFAPVVFRCCSCTTSCVHLMTTRMQD